MEFDKVLQMASDARKNSYSPYSNFQVGACIELKDGTFIVGTNIENAAYGSTMCAERNAIFSAYSNGYRKQDIKALAIIASSDEVVKPCGSCLQVLAELLDGSTPIILANDNSHIILTINDLLPYAFTGDYL